MIKKIKKSTFLDSFFIVIKGIAMGAANKVPGVSGGIVALVGGFYEELIYSFQKLNFKAVKLLFTGRFRSFWQYTNARFLTLLFSGVVISYFSISLLLDLALQHYEIEVYGAFLGMIVASLYYVSRSISDWSSQLLVFLLIGFAMGLWISFTKPIAENDGLLFVLFCGIISVSGMTIPGLSGSFLLLILGNYNLLLVDAVNALFEFITHLIVLDFNFLSDPINRRFIRIISVFAFGGLLGLILFANVIKWVLEKYPKRTLATIIGFIAGSLPLIYPWKTKTYKYLPNGELITNSVGTPQVLSQDYYFPDFSALMTYRVLFFILVGVAILFLLNVYEKKRK